MKALMAVVVLVSAANVYADSTRSIYDIMYLPKAKTVYGFSEVTYLNQKVDFKFGPNAKSKGFALSQTLGYSLTDRLSLLAQASYMNATTKQAGAADYDQSGVSDPQFYARYRLMDEKFQLDILGGAVIGLGDSVTKSNGDTDNKLGGSGLFLGAQWGAKTETLQWSLGAQLDRMFEATTDDKQNGNKYKEKAFSSVVLRSNILNKLAEKSFLRSHLDAKIAEGTSDQVQRTDYELGTEYQHLCKPNLLLRAGVDYVLTDMDSSQYESYGMWRLLLGANYQF